MTITINSREIELKHSFRSYIIYESITDKSFEPKTMTDIITYFYCVVMASDADCDIVFDNFINWLDEHPDTLAHFVEWLCDKQAVSDGLTASTAEREPTKSKKKQSK